MYHYKGQHVQDVCLRYQDVVSPSPLPQSALSLSPGIQQ